MMGVWDWGAVFAGVGLIVYVLRGTGFHLPTRRRRGRAPAVAAVRLPDDYPTTPLPRIPAAPAPAAEPETRLMLRRDELLWARGGDDDEGVITLGLMAAPGGQLGVLMDDNGIAVGVRLDRHEVQGLRDAITNHLVASSKPVAS